MHGALIQQLLGGAKWIGQRRAILNNAIDSNSGFIHDEPTAHRIELPAAKLDACIIESTEHHTVGMVRERLANHRKMLLFHETNRFFAQQIDIAFTTNCSQAPFYTLGIHAIRLLAFQAKQHGLVTAVPFASST
ncbi:hypothetical protein D9M69_508920 [compost metagenome]